MMMRERFQVRAIYAPVAHLAAQAARDFEAETMDGYRALIHRSDIDAVIVLDSSWQGWLPLVAACEAGKAVYWASDLNIDAQRAVELKEQVDKSGIAFMAEFPRRYAPATLRLKELLATKLGKPQLLFCHRRLGRPEPTSNNLVSDVPQHQDRTTRELVEIVDWCRYVVADNPTDLNSTVYGERGQETYRQLSLRFGTGPTAVCAQISAGQYVPSSWQEAIGFRPSADMQICCEHGLAFIDLPSTLVWFDDAGRHVESLETELPVGEQLLIQFHRSVTSLVRKMANLQDAHYALQVIRLAQQSAESGQRICLNELFSPTPPI
ncbi:Inositol 2-dehydrogenase/D-chiro-inositol 3-dehydrogenase [Rosistilla ulvae]|uniref:Inositol 2-dehydrogenase/D-chiro-inositol 3-dehydrogenase n=2 Tax=Rosistilla ulvae TaxID=1930277 RepID=A0A517M6M7_9BACT|nr:Inositol 2-dehydrogenase/D-chiro-inositol 3-dehydrogenase [Rosistilla ulvae]